MNPKRNHPVPIFDSQVIMGNPFKQKEFPVTPFFQESIPPVGIELDYEYALKFMYSYNGSSATFNAYRRELERFFQWSWRIEQRSVLLHQREDIEEFVRFCLNPPLAWIGVKNVPRFVIADGLRAPNDSWRPFVVSVSKEQFRKGRTADRKEYVMGQSSIKSLFTALSSFYDFLTQEDLTDTNPVALIRQKSKFLSRQQHKTKVRRISTLEWEYVIETSQIMANEDPEQHERTLFIMNCLFSMYLRISELVANERSSPVMSDFKKDHDGNWWLHVTGKGNKLRTITVCDEMLMALKRYRKHLNLTPLPASDDATPLIPKNLGRGPMTSTRHIRTIVQNCFDNAFERMKIDGFEEDASELRAATVHWLRHTGISEDVKIRPREHVRDDAGHQTMQTTDRYIESDERERHHSGKKKRIVDL